MSARWARSYWTGNGIAPRRRWTAGALPIGQHSGQLALCGQAPVGPADVGPRLRGRRAGDSVYGDHGALRRWQEARPRASVLAVSGRNHVWWGVQSHQVKSLLAHLPTKEWTRHSAGNVPNWTGWYRHNTVALWAYVFFVVMRAGLITVAG